MYKISSVIKLFFLSLSFWVVGVSVCFSQSDTLYIEKRKCFYDNKYSGGKLIIHYKKDTVSYTSSLDYGLFGFVSLPDSIKLLIIEKILAYECDTSLCCKEVIGQGFNGIEGCRGVPKSKRYTLQVDALYMINRLAWPRIIELYSCYPVLYDKQLKKEINSDQKKIKIVFAAYKKWYAECKAKGRIPKYFPFNDGRYVWFGERKSLDPKE